MNRRQILQSISATAALPMMPKAAIAALPSTPPALLRQATIWAGLWGNTSISTLKDCFYLSDDQTSALIRDLVRDGVINTPARNGVARVLKQHYESPLASVQAHAKEAVAETVEKPKPKDILDRVVKEDIGQDQQTETIDEDRNE